MKSDPEIPKFESEAEEVHWWFDHREETADRMADAGSQSCSAEILPSTTIPAAAQQFPD